MIDNDDFASQLSKQLVLNLNKTPRMKQAGGFTPSVHDKEAYLMNSKSHFNNNKTQRRNIQMQPSHFKEAQKEPVPILQSRLNERQLEIARRGKMHSKEKSDFQSLRSS